jgi:RND family efflux transporter MFP subunit
MKRPWRILLPLIVLAAGGLLAFLIARSRAPIERTVQETPPPLVEVVTAHPRPVTLDVTSQGTVTPHTETTLVAQVAGRVVAVAPELAPGGLFRRGQTLLTIDPRDYQLQVAQAEAQVAQAETLLSREEAEAQLAREEWAELGQGKPSPLTLREPQLAEARGALAAARAALEQARLNLVRTTVEAPYEGRVRARRADIGQFVSPGTPLAEVFAIDYAEVLLPVSQVDLGFLDLPRGTGAGPAVTLTGSVGGASHRWPARVVRTAGEIDPRTRMLPVYARVDDPLGRRHGDRAALPMGLFVEAEIAGRPVAEAFVLPRSAVRGGDQVLVVDGHDRLRFRRVTVIQTPGDRAVVGEGLEAGLRIVVTPLETPVDGMRVRVADSLPAAPSPAAEPVS